MSPASLLGCEKINIYYISKVQAVANKTKVGDGGAGREADIPEKTVFPRTLRGRKVLGVCSCARLAKVGLSQHSDVLRSM